MSEQDFFRTYRKIMEADKRPTLHVFPWNISSTQKLDRDELNILQHAQPEVIARLTNETTTDTKIVAIKELQDHGLYRKSAEVARALALLDPSFEKTFMLRLPELSRDYTRESAAVIAQNLFHRELGEIPENEKGFARHNKIVYIN